MPDGLQELIKSWQRTVQTYRNLTGNAPFILSLGLKLILLFPSLNQLTSVEGRRFAVYQTFMNRSHLFMSVIEIRVRTLISPNVLYQPCYRHWSSLVAQRVKHLPPMQKTWLQSLGQEDLLENEMATHSSTLAWKNPTDGGA